MFDSSNSTKSNKSLEDGTGGSAIEEFLDWSLNCIHSW